MRFEITQHAVERYVKRHAPGLSITEARAMLEQAATSAVRLRERTINGQEQWRIAEPPATLVTKRDGGRIVCVTVLPERGEVFPWDELEALRLDAERLSLENAALRDAVARAAEAKASAPTRPKIAAPAPAPARKAAPAKPKGSTPRPSRCVPEMPEPNSAEWEAEVVKLRQRNPNELAQQVMGLLRRVLLQERHERYMRHDREHHRRLLRLALCALREAEAHPSARLALDLIASVEPDLVSERFLGMRGG